MGRWLLAVLTLAGAASALDAQVPFVGFSRSRGLGITYARRNLTVSGYVSSSFGTWGYYPGPVPFGYPYGRVNVYYFGPPAVVVNPAPVVVAPVQQVFVGNDRDDEDLRERVVRDHQRDPDRFDLFLPRRRAQDVAIPPPEPAPEEPRMPGKPASTYRPVRPADRARAGQAEPPPLRPPARAPEPAPQPPAAPGKRPEPQSLPEFGKKAFAGSEYGRAERTFRQATLDNVGVAMNFFLLAQAQFALGKYREAVEAIHAGMRLQPDWPDARFSPRKLYGPEHADFDEHLKHLEEALERFPADPQLPFLLGYQLWFDGRREKARTLFKRAWPLAPDKTFIDRFLKAEGPAAVAAKR